MASAPWDKEPTWPLTSTLMQKLLSDSDGVGGSEDLARLVTVSGYPQVHLVTTVIQQRPRLPPLQKGWRKMSYGKCPMGGHSEPC